MILDKVLILKGLSGVTALSGAITVGVVGHMNNWWRDPQLTPEEIKTGLGLPADDKNCVLPTNDNETKTCSSINTEKLKNIRFEGKGSSEPTITSSGTVTLTITKTSDTTTFPQGYKFSFNPTGEVTISSTPALKIAKNSNTEFKIKVTDAENGNGAKTLTLEKAWDITKLAGKVGLYDCNTSSKECTLKDGSINVNNGGDNSKIDGSKVKDGEGSSKKLKYQEDQEGYNQGFKFYLEADNDITVTKDANGSGSPKEEKICKKSNSGSGEVYYEIKKDSDNKWYLTKKTNGGSSG